MTDDPDLARDIADLQAFADGLGPFLASLRGRVLTPDEATKLRQIRAILGELRAALVFNIEADDGAALRRVLGGSPEGRA